MVDIVPDAEIEVHKKIDSVGQAWLTYRWTGGSVVGLNWKFLDVAVAEGSAAISPDRSRLKLGPYRLSLVADDPMRMVFYYAREWDLPARFHYWAWLLLDKAYRRTIITLAVWGLASYDPARVPSWEDVRALRRLADWRSRDG